MKAWRCTAALLLLITTGAAAEPQSGSGTQASGEQIYGKVCYACHDAGLWNAPMFGDTAAWKARLAQEGSVGRSAVVAG